MYGSRYLENQVLSTDSVGLVRLLYERAIDSLRHAQQMLAQGRIRERSTAISKAMEIVLELQSSLDLERGGEIAVNLAQLYVYIQERLAAANAERKAAALDEAMRLLLILYDGWKDISAGAAAEVSAVGPLAVEPARAWNL